MDYSKKEIATIFNSVRSEADLWKVCSAFTWLQDNGFIPKSLLFHSFSHVAFRRIYKIN